MFSRAYGTDSTETTFPRNELLGYYQLVPTGQGAQDGKPGWPASRIPHRLFFL